MNEQERIAELVARHRKILLRMMARITGYYALLGVAVAVALALSPGLAADFPLGGLGEIMDPGSSSVFELEEALLSADNDEIEEIVTESKRAHLARGPAWLNESLQLVYAMIFTLLLMLPVSWVYRAIHTDSVYDHSIDTTTLILPAVVAGIVTVVQHSLALAFSLAGIVAGVRFRRSLNDTFDNPVHSLVYRRGNSRWRQVDRNSRCTNGILQLRIHTGLCVWRWFGNPNISCNRRYVERMQNPSRSVNAKLSRIRTALIQCCRPFLCH